ncbi:hypothetical protein UJ101_01000 [Flavobacteriaceae bacterium UJ101]|nr:hypothetical protein UJ101_01000 [Flavobacteriaceae bacterium UJ101]
MELIIKTLSFKRIYTLLQKKSNGYKYFRFGFTFNTPKAEGFLKHYTLHEGFEALILEGVFKEDLTITFSPKEKQQSHFFLNASLNSGLSYIQEKQTLNLDEHIIFHEFNHSQIKIPKGKKCQAVFLSLSKRFLKEFPEKNWDHINKIYEMSAPQAIVNQNYKTKKYLEKLFLAQTFDYGVKTASFINIYKIGSEFFFILYKQSEDRKLKNENTLSIRDILDLNNAYEYMVAHSTSPLTLSEIASLYNMSNSKFRKIFTIHFKIPYKKAVFKLKMEKAKELLLQGYNVSEVSNILNYSQVSKLSQAFKKYHNVLPSKLKDDSKNIDLAKQTILND